MKRMQGKVALITGAGRGIGRASAELFAREGAKVVLAEINEERGCAVEEAIRGAGGEAMFVRADASRSEDVRAACAAAVEAFGGLHALYNNASVFLGSDDGPVTELSEEIWDRVLAVNLRSVFLCSKHAIPLIVESGGGSVIHTSSSAGVMGIPGCDAYTATKGATIALTRSMAVEYGPHKIRVNCIAPAAILTEMVQQSNFSDPAFDEQAFLNTTPVRRWGTPEDVANIALFLASDESSYVNGTVIVADGGLTIT